MKKLMFLGVCFVLLFSAFKSKAQVTTYSTFPDQTVYGYCAVSPPGQDNRENDVIYPEPPSGYWCEGTTLYITFYGSLGDEIDVVNTASYGAINFIWDRSVLDSYPGESFIGVYGWECDYTDGINHYICGGSFN